MEREAEAPNEKAVRDLLSSARQLINEGRPLHALQAVVVAMKSIGGEEAVFQALHRARELYRSRLEEDATVDQLASLFAECAIAETQPGQIESSSNNIACPSIAPDAHGTSILAETGRMQVVLDAVSDGSSFICLKCGGLVSNHRKDKHYAYWSISECLTYIHMYTLVLGEIILGIVPCLLFTSHAVNQRD